MTDEMTGDPMIAALLRQRDGYVQRGLADRVAQVDEQLTLRGHTPPKTLPAPGGQQEGAARSTPPKGRARPRKDATSGVMVIPDRWSRSSGLAVA
ncbi:hypothetical protein [Spongiactinospora sp. 9N601]|uniref:hypothetical protein n=1 Tax=Spongiactinospora sp. 9N601 TaxID=3375149 RepID=UPI00378A83D6